MRTNCSRASITSRGCSLSPPWVSFHALLCESRVGVVLFTRKFFIHPHCINELPVAGALSRVRPARTHDPVVHFRQFNYVPGLSERFAEFAPAKRTHTEIRVG